MENSINPFNSEEDSRIDEGKSIAIIAYLTIIGLIIAFVLNNEKRNDYATFHIRQALGISICFLLLGGVSYIPFIGWIIASIGFLCIAILWVMGVLYAAAGQKKSVPMIGNYFDQVFAGI